MSILEAFILGLVQGITEFLPVSSSGHTIIAGRIMGLGSIPLAFELLIHLATLLAVIIVMRKKVFSLVKKPLSREVWLIVVATVPTVIAALLLKPLIEESMSGDYLVYCFLITAILLVITSFVPKKSTSLAKPKMTFFDAAIIGITQGFAVFPGISRSGSTISASVLLGNDRTESANFSFLISIPIIIGSSILEFASGGASAINASAPALIVGFFTAFLSGLVSITLLLKILSKRNMNGFAVYLVLLSIFMLANKLWLHIF